MACASESDLALRRLSEGSSTARSQSRPPVMWIWVAILTVVAVVAAVVFWLAALAPKTFTPSNTREVPELISVERDDAFDALTKLGLVAVPTELPDEEIPANHVIRTDPAAGERVTTNTTIRVYISTGPESPEVPEIDGLSLTDYTAALEGLGLTVGMVTTQDNSDQPGDRVLAVSPEPGSALPRGRAVDVTVSSGMVIVPDVTGQSIQAATAMLEGLNLVTSVKPNPGCPQQAGVPVVQQSIVGQQPQGSAIEIQYCSG